MKFLGVLLPVVMLLPVIYSVTAIRRAKRQISEMLDALADIKTETGTGGFWPDTMRSPLRWLLRSTISSCPTKINFPRSARQRKPPGSL